MDSIKPAKGIFTTIKVVNTIPLFLERHLIRLGMEEKKDFIAKRIKQICTSNNLTATVVRISVFENGEILFNTRPLPQTSVLSAVTVQSSKKLPTIKQLDRSIYMKAQQIARKNNAKEAVFIKNNNLLETTIANLIIEDKKGNLITPKLTSQGVKGITRQLLLDKKYLTEKNIAIQTKGPFVTINCLRIIGIEKLNNTILVTPLPLMKKVQAILKKEEESYANSYY